MLGYFWVNPKRVPLSDDATREAWTNYLRNDPRLSQIVNSIVPDLLLTEAKFIVSQKADNLKSTETKAAAQLGIVGGGLGVVSVFGSTQATIQQGIGALLIGAGLALVACVLVDAYLIATGRSDGVPYVDVYNSEEVNAVPELKGRVSVSLAEGYLDYAQDLDVLCLKKSRLHKVATWLFIAGVLFLGCNYGMVASQRANHTSASFHCDQLRKGLTCTLQETTQS